MSAQQIISEPPNYQGLRCYYCGDPAESRDHIIPKKWKAPRKERKRNRRKVMLEFGRNTVPACHPCNGLKGNLTHEQFKAEIVQHVAFGYYQKRGTQLWRLAQRLKPFNLKFYGERGTADATFPLVNQSQPFRYKWKAKASRGDGDEAQRIEECAKRGKYRETLAGLMNGK